MKTSILVFALVGFLAGAVQADQLDDAWKICASHKRERRPAEGIGTYHPYDETWTECAAVEKSYLARKNARDEADEEKNPDLATMRAVAKSLRK